MDILGLTGITAAVFITAIGVAFTNGIGWLNSDGSFDRKKAAASALIAFTAGLITVSTTLDSLESGLTDLAQLIIVVGLVATVAGIDFGAKKGLTAAIKPNK